MNSQAPAHVNRRPWAAPSVTNLAPLQNLTLQTIIPPDNSEGSGTFSY